MPVGIDPPPSSIAVRASAPAELLWAVLWVQHRPPQKMPGHLEPVTPFAADLVERVESFWPDRCRVYSELAYLAQASGHLFDLDAEPFLADLEARMPRIGELQLRSETEADKEVILERLRRLRADARLRRRYVELLRAVWAVVRPLWEQDGRPALEKSARLLGERAARAADPMDVVPELARCGGEVVEFLKSAFNSGDVVFSPNYFGGWYLVLDLPGLVLVGTQVDERGRADTRRHEMEAIAGQVRVLSDPTRLAILAHVAEEPANVTELMGLLRLAQPTVSGHMRLLREAGLVRARRQRGRTDYVIDRARLDQLLRSVANAIPAA